MIATDLASPAPVGQAPAVSVPTAVRYPDNATWHRALVGRATIEHRLGLRRAHTPLHLVSITLQRWSDAHDAGFQMLTVGPKRLVYRVVTSFDAPLEVHGNRWSSGRRTFVVDAETGDVLFSVTTGVLVRSGAPALRLRRQ